MVILCWKCDWVLVRKNDLPKHIGVITYVLSAILLEVVFFAGIFGVHYTRKLIKYNNKAACIILNAFDDVFTGRDWMMQTKWIGTDNVSLVTDSIVKFAIKNVALIKTSNALIYRNWILCFLKSKSFRSWMNESLNGSTQQYVSLGEIRKITMKIPNKESIALFNEKMDKIFNEIIYGVNEIIELRKLRDLIVSQISKR